MTSYLMATVTLALSPAVYEIFANQIKCQSWEDVAMTTCSAISLARAIEPVRFAHLGRARLHACGNGFVSAKQPSKQWVHTRR